MSKQSSCWPHVTQQLPEAAPGSHARAKLVGVRRGESTLGSERMPDATRAMDRQGCAASSLPCTRGGLCAHRDIKPLSLLWLQVSLPQQVTVKIVNNTPVFLWHMHYGSIHRSYIPTLQDA
jgi:hypothetical protein